VLRCLQRCCRGAAEVLSTRFRGGVVQVIVQVQRCRRSAEVLRCRGADLQWCKDGGAEIKVLCRCRICVEYMQRFS